MAGCVVKASCFGTPTALLLPTLFWKSWMRKAEDHRCDLVTEYDNQESWKRHKFYIDWKIWSEYDSHSTSWDSYCIKDHKGDIFDRKAFLDNFDRTINGHFEYKENCNETTLGLLATPAPSTESSKSKQNRAQHDTKKQVHWGRFRKEKIWWMVWWRPLEVVGGSGGNGQDSCKAQLCVLYQSCHALVPNLSLSTST